MAWRRRQRARPLSDIGVMERNRPVARRRMVLLAMLGPSLLLTACTGRAAPAAPVPLVGMQGDGLTLELIATPIEGPSDRAQIGGERAIELAQQRIHVQPTARPNARLVTLNVRRKMDNTALIENRRVWLVTFPGATFTSEPCSCVGEAPPPQSVPSTAVALDAADGVFVTMIGLS